MTTRVVDSQSLRLATDPRWFERGERYLAEGGVLRLRECSGGVSAVVRGRNDYLVRLRHSPGGWDSGCSCPLGQDGARWCKHAVAVALAWFREDRPPPEPVSDRTDGELRAFLLAQDAPWLAEQLLRITEDDSAVRARMLAAAGSESAVEECRGLLEEAVVAYDPFLEEWEDNGSERLERAVDTLEDLLDYGYEHEAADLAREALHLLRDRVEEAADLADPHVERLTGIADPADA
ncbi:SWIM zinc finger family protein [Thermobifida halotolerans]|uniref:SWIM zinc finger family protein n=1 Tax=Thermobifida halotolerans TaxID=483545 RepID=A0AA97M467_9ACTN|nr:SWIM zinc finger family protein [Thermobifida halotolerans]UOE19781.1 SWIM zinc finger family protein [Thermobifida halotolerans]